PLSGVIAKRGPSHPTAPARWRVLSAAESSCMSRCLSVASLGLLLASQPLFAEPKVDFNRDIRPILSDNCYQCPRPDKNKRKADLRLDTKEGVLGTVVAGKPGGSELIRRLTTPDKNERMPAPKSGKRLSVKQIEIINKWIDQGAEWRGHWAYLKPVRV